MTEVPDELIDLILKGLSDDCTTLSMACLVNSTFRRISQSILFSCVRLVPSTADDVTGDGPSSQELEFQSDLATKRQCSSFLKLMLTTPDLQHYVRELHLGYYALLDTQTQMVLPNLTRIRTLVIDGTYPNNILKSLDFGDLEVTTRLNLLLSVMKRRTLPSVRQLTLTHLQALPPSLLESCANLHTLTLGMCSFAFGGHFPKPLTKNKMDERHPLYSLTLPVMPTGGCFTQALLHWKEQDDFAINELTLTNMAVVTVDKLQCVSQLLDKINMSIRSLKFGFVLSIDSLYDWVLFFNHPALVDLESISIHLLSTSAMQFFARALSQSKHPSLSCLDIHIHTPTNPTSFADSWQLPQWKELDASFSGDTLATLPRRSVNVDFLSVTPNLVTGTNVTRHDERLASLRKALPRSVERGLLMVHGIPVK